MKHPDIKVGEVYAYAKGKRLYDAAQIVVLDKEKVFWPNHNVVIPMPEGASVPGYYRPRFYGVRRGRPGGDLLVAVKIEVRVKSEIDPDTGQPWDAAQLSYGHTGDRSLWVHDHFEWIPLVVPPRDVRMPWAVYKAKQDEAAARQAEASERSRRHRIISEHAYLLSSIARHQSSIEGYQAAVARATTELGEARQAALEAVTKRNRPMSSQEILSALLDPLEGATGVEVGHPLERERPTVTPSLARRYVTAEDRLASAKGALARQREGLAADEAKLLTIEVPDPTWPETIRVREEAKTRAF